MDIHISNEQHQIASVSKSDFIRAQAVHNRKTTLGEVLSVYTILVRVTADEQLDMHHLEKVHALGSNIVDLDSLVSIIEEIRDSDPIDLIDMDGFFTLTINNYLKYVLNSNITIDSAFLDGRELLEVLRQHHANADEDLKPLVNVVRQTLQTNAANIQYITDFVEDNKIEETDMSTTLYVIPKLRKDGVCFLLGFEADTMSLKTKLNNHTSMFTIRKDEEQHAVLEQIYQSSKFFQNTGYLTIYYNIEEDKLDPYNNRVKVVVWKKADGSFFVIK